MTIGAATPARGGDPAAPGTSAPLSGAEVIQLLDRTIDWYRTLGVQQQAANEPSDLLILYDNRQTAGRVVSLAFDIARADADILAKQPANNSPDAQGANRQITDFAARLDARLSQVQSELDEHKRKLAAGSRQAAELKAKIAELQVELDLVNSRKTLLGTMMGIARQSTGDGFDAGSLKSQIDAMAVALPGMGAPASPAGAQPPPAANAAAGNNSNANPAPPLAGASMHLAARFGIWDLAANVFKLSEKLSTIDGLDKHTAAFQDSFRAIRDPLIEKMKALSVKGDSLANQADTDDIATLNSTRTQLDALNDQFTAASSILVPLGKEGVLLGQYRRNLANWRNIVAGQYSDALKTLGVRVGILVALVGLVLLGGEVWRRAVLRYVHDTRRRYQLLLLKRILTWALIVVIVGLAFASELGSVVTFAGLITAGLAVAMQSVLVSIVGYFFLIGKYGIRVGDKVQIGDVTGQVIDLGLVRLHLMELGAKGQMGPTGRVVAFANSVVFQVSSGLFKQIPGVNIGWHDMTLSLPAGIDYAHAKERLLAAVAAGLKDSHDEIVRQTKEIQRTTASSYGGEGDPKVQLNFSAGGVEAHVHYPVHLGNAAEIDERVSRELISALHELSPSKGT